MADFKIMLNIFGIFTLSHVCRGCAGKLKKAYCSCCCRLTAYVISGSLGQLITLRGRLPEDLGLHYQLQVLTALEYLAKKKVAHLDIKGMLHKVKVHVISLYLQQLAPYLNAASVWLKSNQERIVKLKRSD